MSQELHFKVSSGIKDIVGRDLITDDNIAVFELVKNSFDAHASQVKISFLNLYSGISKIIIEDNGKGMNHVDIKTKWLFLAYSAKKEGTEDNDYRSRIFQDRPFAGSKGIGRISADRLGKKLFLETIKDSVNTKIESLEIDWTKFEQKLTDEFINIPVKPFPSKPALRKDHGTTLSITQLRSEWNRKKLINLRKSLSKLINPEDSFSAKKFTITIICPEETKNDVGKEEYEKATGDIKNFIFDDLEIRTTKIVVQFDKLGKFVTTELKDGGTLIYKIKEKNILSKNLHSIIFKIYYLNKSAKDVFKRRMGVRTREYGSVFVYKNNIRIYPYGEPNEDSFGLDKRKAQKPSVYLGNKDLIGRIEIIKNEGFKETSSRGDGFIKNESYVEFLKFFLETVIDRLERYVIDVQKWGGGQYLSIEDEILGDRKAAFLDKVTHLISKISNSNQIIDFEYEDDILNIIDDKQSDSAIALVNNLFKLAKNSNNSKLLRVAEKTKSRVEELRRALEEAQNLANEKSKELEEKETENLFLKSIKSQDFDDIVSFMHHVGIYAGTIDNYLNGLYKKIAKNQIIKQEELSQIIKTISFELKKILNISAFATKANFKLSTEFINVNVGDYLKEYINNILPTLISKNITIQFKNENPSPYVATIRPIELNIVLDNLVNNAQKAEANEIKILIQRNKSNQFQIVVHDNGKGIPKENMERIFDFGFTTTSGSGLGLFHVKQIIENLKGNIAVDSAINKGTKFIITLNNGYD